jgi:hypothetical protein
VVAPSQSQIFFCCLLNGMLLHLTLLYYKIENLKTRICTKVWIFYKLTKGPFLHKPWFIMKRRFSLERHKARSCKEPKELSRLLIGRYLVWTLVRLLSSSTHVTVWVYLLPRNEWWFEACHYYLRHYVCFFFFFLLFFFSSFPSKMKLHLLQPNR